MKERIINFIDNLKMATLLRLVFITNLIDAFLTLTWINAGIAEEANPLMSYLIDLGPVWFVSGKIFVVLAACFILWKLRAVTLAKFVSLLACLFYIGVIFVHIFGIVNTCIIE